MAEIIVQRDEENRILGLSGKDMEEGANASTSTLHFLEAAISAMSDYLHLAPVFSIGDELCLEVDRSDPHLNREVDAIMETLVIGLNMLAKEYPNDFIVHEADVGVEV